MMPEMMPRGGVMPMFAMEDAMVMDAAPEIASKAGNQGGGMMTAVTRVRSFFPETWVWVDVDSDAGTGLATLPDLVAPDSITTWQFAAFSTHPTGGLAVADESSRLKVFKPFFVSPNLPYSAIRGEELVVRVGVFNYLERSLDVTVEIASSPDFDVVSAGGASSVVSVAAKGTGTATFTIRPKKLGDVDVQVSRPDVRGCGSRGCGEALGEDRARGLPSRGDGKRGGQSELQATPRKVSPSHRRYPREGWWQAA